jgi:hypothetical protein
MKKLKHIVCFSNGIQSASVAIAVVKKYKKENCILLNHAINPYIEPEDITDFGYKISNYLGMHITYANYKGYDASQIESIPNQFDVCETAGSFINPANRQYLCTNRLKTKPFHDWLENNFPIGKNIMIYYGFAIGEENREERRCDIMCSMGYDTRYPLIREGVSGELYEETGISKPKHYNVFNHGNCKGCLKAGKQHWYAIYCLYPEVFQRAKLSEKRIGYSIKKEGYMKDFEIEFNKMRDLGIEQTEKIQHQKFWKDVKKKLYN